MEDDLRSDHADRGAAEVEDVFERLQALLAELREARKYPERLWIRSRREVRIVDVNEIDWVEADAKHSRVHTRHATHRVRESIGRLEERLDPARFARIHRSAIVNLERVAAVVSSSGSSSVVLRNGTRIPMSRSQKPHVFELAADDTESHPIIR